MSTTVDAAPARRAPAPLDPADFPAVLREIARGAAQRELEGQNPFDAVERLRQARLGALRLPLKDGGAGYTFRELFAAVIDLAEADPVVCHIVRTHYWFVEERLRSVESPVRAHWLREIAAGKLFGNATSEHGPAAVGSLRYATALTADGAGFRLSGTKFYCTGTLFSDYVNVWASESADVLASLVVPVGRAGISMVDDWDGMGACKTGSGTTRFENVRVDADEVLTRIRLDGSAPEPTYEFSFLQLYLQAMMAGILRNVVADAVQLVKTRERSFAHAPAERPAEDPLLQQVIGELSASAFAAEAVVLGAADALDAAQRSLRNGVSDARLAEHAALRAAQAKVHVDELAARATSRLFEVGSASSASRKKNLDRHWRAVRTFSVHNPALYKAQAIGRHLVLDQPLPMNGYF